MANEWDFLDSVPDTGFYAVVVTSDSKTVPIATGYAKSIFDSLVSRYPERDSIGIRLGQHGTSYVNTIEDSELNPLINWIDSNEHPRRSGNKASKNAIIFVERFDRINKKFLSVLGSAKTAGLNVIIITAVDMSRPPEPDSLIHFTVARIINLPTKSGEIITTAEIKI